tara:strand:+ start:284 stop:550 length:267 start_codon:yes stop_codon:yes gene_type:complete
MTVIPIYDIKAFTWNGKTRRFAQDAWNLEWINDEQQVVAFPNMKNPFYIKNYMTGTQILFTFVDELYGDWHFISEDKDTYCVITAYPF